MLQSLEIRLQMLVTVFKNQLSIAETAFFQCETPILVNAFICVALQMAECAWNRMKTEGLLRFSETFVACFPESDRYTGLRCHAFVTIKRHISDNRKPLSLLGKIVYCCFCIRSPLRPRLQCIYANSLPISTSEFQFL